MINEHDIRNIPVLLLGSGITVLGTMRSLAAAGITSYCLSKEVELERFSRRFHRVPGYHHFVGPHDDLADYLRRLPFDRAVLMPCSDHWTAAVGNLPADISERFPTSFCRPDIQRRFIDKAEFAETLTQLDVPHPRTIVIRSEQDFAAISDADLPRYFLKPRDSQGFFQKFQLKGFQIVDRQSCLARYRMIDEAGFEVVAQEFLEGPATNHFYIEGFVDRHGVICAVFARQRLRMAPPLFGNSTAMVSIAPETVSDAIESTKRLLTGVGYRGIYSAEFKQDQRDGRFKLLEVNSRPWWYIEFAKNCGVNVAVMAYHDALGHAVKPVPPYRVGVRSVNLYTDFMVQSQQWREGKLAFVPMVREWCPSHFTMFSCGDPLPALRWIGQRVKSKMRRILARRKRGGGSV